MQLNARYPQLFTWPALVHTAFFIVPSLSGIFFAFTTWSSYSDEVNFVGLKNFYKLFSADENDFTYFGNTFVFTAVTIVLKAIFGLGLALLLDKGVRTMVNVYRALIYVPVVLPMLVVGLIFRGLNTTSFPWVAERGFAGRWPRCTGIPLVDSQICIWPCSRL